MHAARIRRDFLLSMLFLALLLALLIFFPREAPPSEEVACLNLSGDVSLAQTALLVWLVENNLSDVRLAEPFNPCLSLNASCHPLLGYAVEEDGTRLGFLILNESAFRLVDVLQENSERDGLAVYPASFFSRAAPSGENGVSIVSRLNESLGVVFLIPLSERVLMVGETMLSDWDARFEAFRVQEPAWYDAYLSFMNASWPQGLVEPPTCIQP